MIQGGRKDKRIFLVGGWGGIFQMAAINPAKGSENDGADIAKKSCGEELK